MWFCVQLDRYLPLVPILVGHRGLLYIKLVEIGKLLGKTNPYVFRTMHKRVASRIADVIPWPVLDVQKKTMEALVVPIDVAHRLMMEDNPSVGELFSRCLFRGFAHPRGLKKFVANERKAPILVCVEEMDELSVFIPDWIEEFNKDLIRYHQDQVSKTSGITADEPSGSSQVSRENGQVSQTSSPRRKRTRTLSAEVDTSTREFFVVPESVVELSRTDSFSSDTNSEARESLVTDVPAEKKQQPPRETIAQLSVETSQENESGEGSDEIQMHHVPVAFVNLDRLSFVPPSGGNFLRPGDFIVQFRETPPRVFFVKGETEGLFSVNESS